jgi:hypothetical protein
MLISVPLLLLQKTQRPIGLTGLRFSRTLSVHRVRCKNGRKWWRTESAARKDAAFQAYVALYEAGLVNNNLLPLNREGAVVRDAREELPSMMEVSEQLKPWISLAKAWAFRKLNQTVISIQQQDGMEGGEVVMVLTTPLAMPCTGIARLPLRFAQELRSRWPQSAPRAFDSCRTSCTLYFGQIIERISSHSSLQTYMSSSLKRGCL